MLRMRTRCFAHGASLLLMTALLTPSRPQAASPPASLKPSANDSWDTIRADRSVDIRQGAYADTFGPEGFFNSCIYANTALNRLELRNTAPVLKLCTTDAPALTANPAPGSGPAPTGKLQCTYYKTGQIALPLQQTAQICAEYIANDPNDPVETCARFVNVTFSIPTELTFDVFSSGVGVATTLLFSKPYTIQNCAAGFDLGVSANAGPNP